MEKNLVNVIKHIMEGNFANANGDLKAVVKDKLRKRLNDTYADVKASHVDS